MADLYGLIPHTTAMDDLPEWAFADTNYRNSLEHRRIFQEGAWPCDL